MNSVILVGGGYSIKEGIEKGLWNEIKNQEIWSLNIAFKTMPYLPSKELFVDHSFFNSYQEDLLSLPCELIAVNHAYYLKFPKIKNIFTTQNPKEFYGRESLNKNKIFTGSRKFCGFFAISYAIALGYKTIYLLGYDWGNIIDTTGKKQSHYFDNNLKDYGILKCYQNPKYNAFENNNNQPKEDVKDFEVYLTVSDCKIYNVSLKSRIDYFEKINFETFYNHLKKEENETNS